MNEPILSAIVSTYNSERFLRGCLDDLLQQTIADRMEILVIDACSPQNEGAIVREYQARHPNLQYVRTAEREPLYASWNRGIAAARGKYVTNANTDDRHTRNGLERLVAALEANSGAALAYGDAGVTLRENATLDDQTPSVVYRWPEFDARLLFKVAFVGPQPVWRRDLHDRYGWFDTSYISAGDYEWWLRLAVHGERFLHVPEILGLYLSAPGSIEHRDPDLSRRESEAARLRHWSESWGTRPRAGGFYLRPNLPTIARQLLRGNFSGVREIAAHAAMIVRGRFRRRS